MARGPLRSLFCVILACSGLPGGALAAELGDARVVSHIGQQLVADIELTALSGDAPVQVRLASADVYRGAGIAMPPVLSGLNLTVTRRGARQFVHVTSQGPVQAEYLHLYLELADGNERGVRLATLWLTPDPTPAPPAVVRPVQPAAVAEPAPAPKVPPQPEPKLVPKVEAKPAPAFRPEPAHARKAVPAAKPAPTPAPVVLPISAPAAKPTAASKSVPKPVPAPRVQPIVAPKLAAARVPVPAPAPPLADAAKPASCMRPDPTVLKTCVALDYKNAQLKAQIGQLEDKVKVLQLAIGSAPVAGSLRPAAQPVNTKVRLVPHVAKPKKVVPPPEPAFPWVWLALGGAVLLAGAGAAALVVRRRKAEQERKARALKATLPPIMGSVKNRLMSGQGAAETAEATADAAEE